MLQDRGMRGGWRMEGQAPALPAGRPGPACLPACTGLFLWATHLPPHHATCHTIHYPIPYHHFYLKMNGRRSPISYPLRLPTIHTYLTNYSFRGNPKFGNSLELGLGDGGHGDGRGQAG